MSFNPNKRFYSKNQANRSTFTNNLNRNLSYNKHQVGYLNTPFANKLEKNFKYNSKKQQEVYGKKRNHHSLLNGALLLTALGKHEENASCLKYLSEEEFFRRTIDKYDQVTFSLTDVPPPNQHISQSDDKNFVKTSPTFYGLSNQEAKNALIKYVSNNYCTNTSIAKRIHIEKIENSNIFTYTLETFSEKRQTCLAYEPYNGGYVDNLLIGKSPPVWDIIPSYDPQPFKDRIETLVIPHSEYIQNCYSCKSNGRKHCISCHGNAYEKCYVCHGEGYKKLNYSKYETEKCLLCNGNGYRKCYTCNGDGFKKCKICTGTGQLKCYLKLIITWRNHIDDFVPDNICIPKDRLKFVTGDIIYNDTNSYVWPIEHFTDFELNKASEKLINKHSELYLKLEKLIMQRQMIHVIQISTIYYKYRNKLGVFWIYGKELKVYAPDYPKNCCTCCNII